MLEKPILISFRPQLCKTRHSNIQTVQSIVHYLEPSSKVLNLNCTVLDVLIINVSKKCGVIGVGPLIQYHEVQIIDS